MRDHTPGRDSATAGLFERIAELPLPVLFLLCFAAVALSHLTLLHLPYFWDEGGYYVPAALDFYRSGTLIPEFTNAHPPLPNVVLGLLWHAFGFHIVVTRLAACAFAAAAFLAIFSFGKRLLNAPSAFALMCLTGVYPIWFAQSSLAHADIFAAAFSLIGIGLFLTSPELAQGEVQAFSSPGRLSFAALFFSLSVLSKETAIVHPAALAAYMSVLAFRNRANQDLARAFRRWVVSFSAALPVLVIWYAYHLLKTGYIFGNPVYLRYNATANFTVAHVLYGLRIRFVHLLWQRNIWVPAVLTLACLLLPRRAVRLSPRVVAAIAVLALANLVAFSILGGALLTRYLLPVYPLLLLVYLSIWRERTSYWPWLAFITGFAFVTAIWSNPWAFFAPEDNLTYRDMVVVQRDAIRVLEQHYPLATVLTAWPASADLFRPELGYTDKHFKVYSVDDFMQPSLAKAAQEADRFDTALVFTTHYLAPEFRKLLVMHPDSWRGRRYASQLDLTPAEIARLLHGHVVWQEDRNGEWAAILRFDRSYTAGMHPPPHPLTQAALPSSSDCIRSSPPSSTLRYTSACNPVP